MDAPKLIKESILWAGYGKEILEREFELSDGARPHFYGLRGTTSPVIIFALTGEEEVIAVKQFRYGANAVVLEIPGGVIGRGELPEETVLKELVEETGYKPEQVVSLGQPIWFEPASYTHPFFPYLAVGCRKVAELKLEKTEIMESFLIPLEEWLGMIWTGAVRDSKTLAVTLLALHYLARI